MRSPCSPLVAATIVSVADDQSRSGSVDWDRVARDLAPIDCDRNPATLKRKGRDYFWFSPLLKIALDSVRADIVVMPADVEDVTTVVRYCVRHRLPITMRGAGTGNYGQAMPLEGGVVLDMSRLNRVLWSDRDAVRAQAGAKLIDLDRAAGTTGGELRFHPSTWKTATVGGFVAGGATGCGAINYGTLHGANNVRAVQVLTIAEEPELIELRGSEAQAVVHAYGTNGIILEVEMGLAPARSWLDRIVGVADLPAALALLDRIARDDAVGKKELALLDTATVALMRPLADLAADGRVLIVAMIDAPTLPAFEALVAEVGAEMVFEREHDARGSRLPPLYELCWNHTTLHAIGRDPSITYLQLAFPPDYLVAVPDMVAELGDETPIHLEMARIDDIVTCIGIPLVRYTSEARLDEICAAYRRRGCTIFNPHTVLLETGGVQMADPAQLAFRRIGDPRGLLNRGKMPGWDVDAGTAGLPA